MTKLRRREVIRKTLLGSSLLVVSPTIFLEILPHSVWAQNGLSDRQSKTLTGIVRCLFPHSRLDISIYQNVVTAIERDALARDSFRELLLSGLEALDKKSQGSWLGLTKEKQIENIAAFEDTEFFKALWQKASYLLYQEQEVWGKFGYEGPSYPKGGYVSRGFNDIDWVPGE